MEAVVPYASQAYNNPWVRQYAKQFAKRQATNAAKRALKYLQNSISPNSKRRKSNTIRNSMSADSLRASDSLRNGSMSSSMKSASVRTARGNELNRIAKRSSKGGRKKKSLKKRLAILEKDLALTYAVKEVRSRTYAQLVSTVNDCVYLGKPMWYNGYFEPRLVQLKYLTRATAPAIVEMDLAQANTEIDHNIDLKNIYLNVKMVNAADTPCTVRVYWYKCKDNAASNPSSLMAVGDQYAAISSADTNIQAYPGDIKVLNDQWSLIRTDKAVLRAGDEFNSTYTQKKSPYNPLLTDALSSPTFLKGDVVALFRLEGCLSHDFTTDTLIGISAAHIDIQYDQHFDVRYQSDVAFRYKDLQHGTTAIASGTQAGPAVEEIRDVIP